MTSFPKLMASAFLTCALMLGATGATAAETHVVQMLNKHPDDPKQRQVFYPSIVRAEVGDTIQFVSVDKGHNAASIDGMIPEGAEPWKSKINEDFEITVTEEGIYGYQCTPHYGMGMVGLILVGDHSANLDQVLTVKHRGKARQVFDELLQDL